MYASFTLSNRLDLRSNDIHDGGLDALAEGMECNASVERLFVWGNHFGQVRFAGFNLHLVVDDDDDNDDDYDGMTPFVLESVFTGQ